MNLYDNNDLDINIDLTPLLDVLFILLLFFILTATFSKPFLEMLLPEAKETQERALDSQDILISVPEKDIYLYNDEELNKENLTDFFENLPIEGKLIFQISEEVPFSSFVTLIDAAKGSGRNDFLIQTKKATYSQTF